MIFLLMVKILCFIDNLGPGGAQRQMVNLALGFKSRGHDVSFLVYGDADFYIPILRQHSIKIDIIHSANYIARIYKCRKYIRTHSFNIVLAFLETPSLIAELSSVPSKKWKLIVGERSSNPKILKSIKGRVLRLMHCYSDFVVSNSNANRKMVKQANPFLHSKRNLTIYNVYDLEKLTRSTFKQSREQDGKFHLVIAASHRPVKNFPNLALAVSRLDRSLKSHLAIDWYGQQNTEYFKEYAKISEDLQISDIIHFYPPTMHIYEKMANADAVGLFSLYEGLSNTICEAMCLSVPVIATDISDNKELIQESQLISNPDSPQSIARSLSFLMHLTQRELDDIGNQNRRMAERLFSSNDIIDQYLKIMI